MFTDVEFHRRFGGVVGVAGVTDDIPEYTACKRVEARIVDTGLRLGVQKRRNPSGQCPNGRFLCPYNSAVLPSAV